MNPTWNGSEGKLLSAADTFFRQLGMSRTTPLLHSGKWEIVMSSVIIIMYLCTFIVCGVCVVCGMCVRVCAAGEKNEVEFLQTTEGDQFQCIFSKVRYGSIVSDPQSVQTLDEDRIVPQSKPFDMGRRREGGGSLGPLEAVFLQLVRSCHSTSLCELG